MTPKNVLFIGVAWQRLFYRGEILISQRLYCWALCSDLVQLIFSSKNPSWRQRKPPRGAGIQCLTMNSAWRKIVAYRLENKVYKFHEAVRNGDLPQVKYFLTRGRHVDDTDRKYRYGIWEVRG